MRRILAAALAVGVSVFALSCNAAEVYRLTTDDKSQIIIIDGDLDYDTVPKVRYALNKFGGWAGFILNSPGGSTKVAHELQAMIITMGERSKTSVPAYGVCASACVDVLVAGATIQVHPTSQIGVHQGISKKTGLAGPDLYATKLYRIRGVPESVVTKMNITPPEQMSWMTKSEFLAIPGAKLSTYAVTTAQFIQAAQYRVDHKN